MTSPITPEGRASALQGAIAEASRLPPRQVSWVWDDSVHALIAAAIRDAENEARCDRRYHIPEPEGGWRKIASFTPEEKAKLRPIAETLSMLDGNAFLSMKTGNGQPWHEGYLAEADALYQANGGDTGWASEASFVRALKPHPVPTGQPRPIAAIQKED